MSNLITAPRPRSVFGAVETGSTQIIVGVADFKLSCDPYAEIVTYALGSCLGITFYDQRRQIGSLLHVMLPDSRLHSNADQRPAMFVDTGVQLALEQMRKAGAREGDMRCKVFGGAQVNDSENFFKIGANNSQAFSELSRELGLMVLAWEISGRVNRSIRLYNRTGEVLVRLPGRPDFIR